MARDIAVAILRKADHPKPVLGLGRETRNEGPDRILCMVAASLARGGTERAVLDAAAEPRLLDFPRA
jgi:hypothetical protein